MRATLNNKAFDAGRAVAPRPPVTGCDGGRRGAPTLPTRKRLNHRGPLSVDVESAWYFVTVCAENHAPWVATKCFDIGRAVAPRPPSFDHIAALILREARENHSRGIWRLSLFLVMPDHMHFIVNVPHGGRRGAPTLPTGARNGGRGTPTLPTGARNGGRGATALPKIVSQFKHLLAVRYGMRFQRDFWDTRLRDDAHYAEKFRYVCNNPVRKGLCVSAREWQHVIAFDRMTGEEKPHR